MALLGGLFFFNPTTSNNDIHKHDIYPDSCFFLPSLQRMGFASNR